MLDKKREHPGAMRTEHSIITTTNIANPRRNVKCLPDEWENSYVCPICGELLGRRDEVYVDRFGSVLGCEACIEIRSAEYFCKEATPYDLI